MHSQNISILNDYNLTLISILFLQCCKSDHEELSIDTRNRYIQNILHFYVEIWFSVEFIHLWIQYCPVVSWLSPQRIQFSSNALLHGCNSKYTKLVSSHKLDFVSKVHVHNKTATLFIFVLFLLGIKIYFFGDYRCLQWYSVPFVKNLAILKAERPSKYKRLIVLRTSHFQSEGYCGKAVWSLILVQFKHRARIQSCLIIFDCEYLIISFIVWLRTLCRYSTRWMEIGFDEKYEFDQKSAKVAFAITVQPVLQFKLARQPISQFFLVSSRNKTGCVCSLIL